KRNVGIIRKFVFNSGAEDEPISPSEKLIYLKYLKVMTTPRDQIFSLILTRMCALEVYCTEEEEAQELTLCYTFI
ncbi:hypothetical protein MKW92_044089, partial [Papaver armeniacum]